jgi:hypothetical protein
MSLLNFHPNPFPLPIPPVYRQASRAREERDGDGKLDKKNHSFLEMEPKFISRPYSPLRMVKGLKDINK